MSEQAESPDAGLVDGIKKNARLTVISGVVTLIAGTLAIIAPFVAGVSITILVGAMLAISGISQCFLAFKTGAFGRGLMVFVVGVLMTIVGIYMMNQPVAGLKTLTIILMSYLLVTGALEIIVSFQLKTGRWLGNGAFQRCRDLAARHHAMASVSGYPAPGRSASCLASR